MRRPLPRAWTLDFPTAIHLARIWACPGPTPCRTAANPPTIDSLRPAGVSCCALDRLNRPMTLLEAAVARLREEHGRVGLLTLYERLQRLRTAQPGAGDYAFALRIWTSKPARWPRRFIAIASAFASCRARNWPTPSPTPPRPRRNFASGSAGCGLGGRRRRILECGHALAGRELADQRPAGLPNLVPRAG